MKRLRAYRTDHFRIPLPEGHPFPASKYGALRQLLQQSPEAELIQIEDASAASDTQLQRVHTAEYLHKVNSGGLSAKEQRRIGFPWTPELVERSRRSTGATLDATAAAMAFGFGVNLAGGTHHAFADMGQGFCIFNDVAVAVREAQQNASIRKAIVLDCDVHQGNGTASIFAEDPNVFTCSIHCEKNYPFRRCDGDLEIALPEGVEDEVYLAALDSAIQSNLPWADSDIVYYIAGADPFAGDRLGLFNLSADALAARDAMVFNACIDRGLPLVVTMGGGYASDIRQIALIHATTVCLLANLVVNH